jgi:hypothetical protein
MGAFAFASRGKILSRTRHFHSLQLGRHDRPECLFGQLRAVKLAFVLKRLTAHCLNSPNRRANFGEIMAATVFDTVAWAVDWAL